LPFYEEQPNLIFDRKHIITWKEFVEKYRLCNKGLYPKHLKLGKYIEDVEVEKFKSCINKNNYRYFWLDDDEFIAKAENLRKT
jgi:hypothetical protein